MSPCHPVALLPSAYCMFPSCYIRGQQASPPQRDVPPPTSVTQSGKHNICFFSLFKNWLFLSQAGVSGQAEVLDALRPRDTRHLHHYVLLRRTGQCIHLGPHTVYLHTHKIFVHTPRCFHDSHLSYGSNLRYQNSSPGFVRLMCRACTTVWKTASSPLWNASCPSLLTCISLYLF